jgi:hypothetical protein
MPEVNRGEVVAAVRSVFERYEAALVANDLNVLDELFWDSPHTDRFGLGDRQQGFTAVRDARRALERQTPRRTLRDVVATEFVPEDGTLVGRQSQTWVCFPEGWRVVSAHVSWPVT